MFLKEKSKGFTLIELLVVISIIALLLSILLPSLQKAKEQGRSLVCQSNLKQIGFAALLWAEDHDGWTLGGAWSWKRDPDSGITHETSLGPYLDSARGDTGDKGLRDKGIYACPTARNLEFPPWSGNGKEYQDNKTMTYGINGWIASKQDYSPGTKGVNGVDYWLDHGVTKLLNIRTPSKTIYFMDNSYFGVYPWTFDPFTPMEDLPQPTATRWHGKLDEWGYGFSNIVCVDGSVSKEPEDLGLRPKAKRNPRWEHYFFKRR